MDFIKVIILGIVEGVTEFLPISSTGHLILAHELLPLEPKSFGNAFDVMIQLGAILAVCVLYYRKLNPFSKKTLSGKPAPADKFEKTMNLWLKVVIGVLPAAVLGFFFDDFIDEHLFHPLVVAAMLIIWGILILVIEGKNKKSHRVPSVHRVEDLSYGTAFSIGLFQCFAMIPGTSRSAATIMGGLILGTSRTAATEFSFFLAIPTMIGATLLKIVKSGLSFTARQWALVILGGVVSFLVALLVIKKFLGYIRQNDFQVFGIYRIILGIVVILFSLFTS